MEILIILLLILLNGIFAMSEIAMVSSRKSRLEKAAKNGDKSAQKALDLSLNPGKFLSTVQIGITLIGILTGIYSGERIEDDLIHFLNQFDTLKDYSKMISVTVIVVTLTFFSLVLGELVPKRIGLTMPESISKIFSYPMYWISIIAAPFIWLLTATTDLIIKLMRISPSAESNITEEDIIDIIKEGTEGGAIEKIEKDIVEKVFSLGDSQVSSLMINRENTVVLDIDFDKEKIRDTVNQKMHTVYPVLSDQQEVLGVILLKDLFKYLNSTHFQLTDHLKEPQFIDEDLSAYELLKLFKKSKTHQAVVIDKRGQMKGFITLNDLLQALIEDVSEIYGSDIIFTQQADGKWLVDGQYPLIKFLRKFGLQELIEEYPFETISGLILHQLRRVPTVGETFRWNNFQIEILQMDVARIDKVLITNLK